MKTYNKWTEQEVELLSKYKSMGINYLVTVIKRNAASIRSKAKQNNIIIPKQEFLWSDDKIQFLIENYPQHGSKYCAKKLKVTPKQVHAITTRLKIKYICQAKQTKEGYRICYMCKIEKPFAEFSKRKNFLFGIHCNCKVCASKKQKKTRKKYSKRIRIYTKNYYEQNKEHILQKAKDNLPKYKEYRNDPAVKLMFRFRNKFEKVLFAKWVCPEKEKILGCSTNELRSHMEKQFTSKFSWDNYAKAWQIDHIIPISIIRHYPEKYYLVFNYRNYRPVSHSQNIRKSDSIDKAKTALQKQIKVMGNDEFYQEMLDFLKSILQLDSHRQW